MIQTGGTTWMREWYHHFRSKCHCCEGWKEQRLGSHNHRIPYIIDVFNCVLPIRALSNCLVDHRPLGCETSPIRIVQAKLRLRLGRLSVPWPKRGCFFGAIPLSLGTYDGWIPVNGLITRPPIWVICFSFDHGTCGYRKWMPHFKPKRWGTWPKPKRRSHGIFGTRFWSKICCPWLQSPSLSSLHMYRHT